MCTVTYIPTGNNAFILTQNRDESPGRTADELVRIDRNGKTLMFPKDTGAGGTWIAVSTSNQLVSILNGAFDRHQHRPPYRKSRGIMALEFFDFTHAGHFFTAYDFHEIEPFTMLVYDDGRLYDFRWDGQYKYVEELENDQPHLLASASLYTKEVRQKRKKWFEEWMKSHTDFSRPAVLNFHMNAGDGDPENDLVMNRANKVRTTSITSIIRSDSVFDLYFSNLLNGKVLEENLTIRQVENPG